MTALGIAVRLLHLAASTQLVGTFVFLSWVARPAWQMAGPGAEAAAADFDRRLLQISRWALLVGLLTGVAGLAVQAATVIGTPVSPSALIRLLTGTQYGAVWMVRMGTLLLLGGFLLFSEQERDGKDRWAFRLEGGLLAAFAAAALAWAGHAAAIEDWGLWPLAADSLHLLATGAWLGGLLPLSLLLTLAVREPGAAGSLVAREAARRFSTLALPAVGLLVLTGLVNAWVHVREFPPLVGTPYGRLLLVKLAVLGALLGIAAVNRTRLNPRLLAAPPDRVPRHDLLRLRRNVCLEATLGFGILLVVSGLGLTPPARHIEPSWPFPFRLSWEANKDIPGVRTAVTAGSAGVLVGTAALGYGILRARHRPWAIATGLGFVGYFGLVSLRYLAVDAYPTTYRRPAVPYHALSVANGARLYKQHCAVCHGVAGYGDGPAARGLRPRPADLTAKHAADHTVGDLFWWLTHGIPRSAMAGFADRLSEEDRWDLINLLRTLAAAEQARGLGPLVEPDPSLVAPDFAYTTGVGESRSLKDYRGQRVVVLVLFSLPDSTRRLLQLSGAYPDLRRSGAEVLGIPLRAGRGVYRELGEQAVYFPIVVDGATEAAASYTLFRRDLTAQGQLPDPPIPRHMELLVDRQGYLRARWIPGDGIGWADPARLVAEVERLAAEAPRAPAPDEHVH